MNVNVPGKATNINQASFAPGKAETKKKRT
jgi:hypothetical protein